MSGARERPAGPTAASARGRPGGVGRATSLMAERERARFAGFALYRRTSEATTLRHHITDRTNDATNPALSTLPS